MYVVESEWQFSSSKSSLNRKWTPWNKTEGVCFNTAFDILSESENSISAIPIFSCHVWILGQAELGSGYPRGIETKRQFRWDKFWWDQWFKCDSRILELSMSTITVILPRVLSCDLSKYQLRWTNCLWSSSHDRGTLNYLLGTASTSRIASEKTRESIRLNISKPWMKTNALRTHGDHATQVL